MQQPGLCPRADVLERHRRPVKQLERPDVLGDGDEGNGEIERILDEGAQRIGCDLVAQQVGADNRADLDDIAVGGANRIHLRRRERIQPLRHVEAAIRSRAGKQRIYKGDRGRRSAAAHPVHAFTASGRIGTGLPSPSTATSITSASVTLTFSPRPIPLFAASHPQRSASTSTRMVTEVRPMRTSDGKKLTRSPVYTGSWNSTSRIALVT